MKKVLFLSLVLIAMMVVACGPSQEEVVAEATAQEQLVADSISAYEAQLTVEIDTTVEVVEIPVAE